jgi:hypothetical protein
VSAEPSFSVPAFTVADPPVRHLCYRIAAKRDTNLIRDLPVTNLFLGTDERSSNPMEDAYSVDSRLPQHADQRSGIKRVSTVSVIAA